MIWFVDALLFVIAAVLALIAATRGRVVLRDSAREGVLDFFKLMPRIMLGVTTPAISRRCCRRRWWAAGSARTPA